MGLPYVRSSSSLSSKTASNRNRRLRSNNDSVAQRPTEFLCRLIRKVYSTNEIVAGITHDERLDRIKGKIRKLILVFYKIYYYYYVEAVADRYFPGEPERFESFWTREAHQSILGQARAQRCRDKKAGYIISCYSIFLHYYNYLEIILQIIVDSQIRKSNRYRLVIIATTKKKAIYPFNFFVLVLL
jgi:hypothetical protein